MIMVRPDSGIDAMERVFRNIVAFTLFVSACVVLQFNDLEFWRVWAGLILLWLSAGIRGVRR